MLTQYLNRLDDIIFSLNTLSVNMVILAVILCFSLPEFILKRLNFSGFISSTIVGFGVFRFLHSKGIILLLLYYFFCIITEKYCKKRYNILDKKNFEIIENKDHKRDSIQVLANGGLALFVALYHYYNVNYIISANSGELALVMFGAVLSEALSDSVASAVGKLSINKPISILTRMPVEKGTSGGFTFLGFIASAVSSAVLALAWLLLFNISKPLYSSIVIFLAGVFGTLTDSLLGASVQVLYRDERTKKLTEKPVNKEGENNTYIRGMKWINNDTVNFISNLSALMVSVLLCFPVGIS